MMQNVKVLAVGATTLTQQPAAASTDACRAGRCVGRADLRGHVG